jgi:tetratricopeptide (TPR) repeat protein
MVAQAKLISSLGLAMRDRGDFTRAFKLQQSAADLDSENFQIQINLGVAHQDLNQIKLAINAFSKAIDLSADQISESHLTAHLNHCMASLRLGPSFELFKAFLVRWQVKRWPQQPYQMHAPHWLRNDDYSFERLLIMSDQGHGDNMMSLPAIAWLAEKMPGKLTVMVKQPLFQLFKVALSSLNVEVAVEFKGQASGWLTGLDILGVYSQALGHYQVSRQQIENNLKAHFQHQSRTDIAPFTKAVALCWRGNPEYSLDRWRTLPMQDMLNAVESCGHNTHLIPLLIDLQEAELRALNKTGVTWSNPQGDFLETAMLMMQAQSVWTADSACTHLAGICGVPAWVGVSLPSDWRWPVLSGPCAWYPQVQVYRQTELRNWTPFIHLFKKWLRQDNF